MTNRGDDLRHEVHREELYAQVWSEPMVRLAKRYGVSDVALAKVCRKLDIPVPPRGYWRRLETGWRPVPPPLPKLRPGLCGTATISPQPRREGSGKQGPEIEAQEAFECQSRNRIRVPRQLVDPHPLVRRTAEVLRSAGPGLYGTVNARREKCLDLRVGPRSLERALRIMDALVKALERRGFRVTISTAEKPETQVEMLGQRLSHTIVSSATTPSPYGRRSTSAPWGETKWWASGRAKPSAFRCSANRSKASQVGVRTTASTSLVARHV